MSRRSRSPRRRNDNEGDFRAPGGSRDGGYNSRRRNSKERANYGNRNREREYSGRDRDGEKDYKSSRRDDAREGERRRPERDFRDYDEGTRERERQRDRERYDSGRDRAREHGSSSHHSQRRSASPRRGGGSTSASPAPVDKEKFKPDFKASGLLAAETNTVKAIDGTSTVLKYNEPPEARKPIVGWRLYVFKDSEQVELLHIHRQSAYLVGRDRLVADIPIEHPSCSKQHAVFQYRYVQEKDEYGGSKGVVKPFVIDLESTNGTIVNDETIPAARYYELKAGDVIKFGLSTREYVLLHDEVS